MQYQNFLLMIYFRLSHVKVTPPIKHDRAYNQCTTQKPPSPLTEPATERIHPVPQPRQPKRANGKSWFLGANHRVTIRPTSPQRRKKISKCEHLHHSNLPYTKENKTNIVNWYKGDQQKIKNRRQQRKWVAKVGWVPMHHPRDMSPSNSPSESRKCAFVAFLDLRENASKVRSTKYANRFGIPQNGPIERQLP